MRSTTLFLILIVEIISSSFSINKNNGTRTETVLSFSTTDESQSSSNSSSSSSHIKSDKNFASEQAVCIESKISYNVHHARYHWKVFGLCQFLGIPSQNDLLLETTVKFVSLPDYADAWTFSLRKQNNSPLNLTATVKSPISESNSSLTNFGTAFEIQLLLGEGARIVRSIRPSRKYFQPVSFDWIDIESKVNENGYCDENEVELKLNFFMSVYEMGSSQSNAVDCEEIAGNPTSTTADSVIVIAPSTSSYTSEWLHGNLMRDDQYADLVIKTGDEEFQVHRAILANSSPVFATLIYNKTFDKNESLIDLGEEIGSDVVEEIIRYVYTGIVDDIEEVADRLLVAANKFQFIHLKQLCESSLLQQVKMDNAFNMYILAKEVQANRLMDRAFEILKENKAKLVSQPEEFRKLSVHHPEIMYKLFLA